MSFWLTGSEVEDGDGDAEGGARISAIGGGGDAVVDSRWRPGMEVGG